MDDPGGGHPGFGNDEPLLIALEPRVGQSEISQSRCRMDGWGSSGPVLDFAGYQTRTWESEGGRVRATVMPARRSSLIGRERDLDTIADLAIHNDGRLVTLTGVGGVGKTALVHEIGRSVIERIPDGVRPVDLAPLPEGVDADAVALACLTGLGLAEQPRRPFDVVADHLAPRHSLLILDNCEHVQPAVSQLLEELLDACPYLRVVATSRAPLRVRGETVFRVQPLAIPAAESAPSPASLAAVPAVELFLLRARAADTSFELNATNAADIAEICRQLAGLPLALELAAARVSSLTPAEISARLGGDPRLFASDTNATPERQRSLDDTLEWSHRLLTPDQQTLFRRLAVFAGGWTLEAAEAICSVDGEGLAVAPALSALVEQSLVVRDAKSSPSRFQFLQPIAQFAVRKLAASGETATLGVPHARYYLALAAARDPGRQHATPADLDRIAANYENCLAALRFAEAADALPLTAALVASVTEFWRVRGRLREAIPHLEASRQMAGPQDIWPRAVAIGVLADFHRLLGQLEPAEAYAHEVVEISDTLGDRYSRRTARGLMAGVLRAKGDVTGARAAYEAARLIIDEDPEPVALGFYHVGVALLSVREGSADTDDAHAHLTAAVELFRSAGGTWYLGRALAALGAVDHRRGDLENARAHLVEGFAELVAFGARLDAIETIEELGRLALDHGDAARAARLLGAASSLRDAMAISVPAAEQAGLTAAIDGARELMAADAFIAAWTEGRAMSFEDVARVAAELGSGRLVPVARTDRRSPGGTTSSASPLTRRETEIASLVARGMTNPQIAEELYISPGTARVHVERILGKLGLTSRVQVATWVVEGRHNGGLDRLGNMSPDGRAAG